MNLKESRFSKPERASLPQKVADLLKREIAAAMKPGDRLPGMHVLRQRFAVSINTLSAALDLLAREGVLVKRHGSGVFVAERAGRRRIGILSELNLLDPRIGPFFRAEADALKSQLAARGDEPVLYVGDAVPGEMPENPTCPQFWADAADGRLDGAVILNAPNNAAWEARIRQCPVPAVGFWTGYEIRIDFESMVTALVNRLAALGCRRIGLLAWHQDAHFRKALAVRGLAVNDAWIRCGRDPAVRGSGWEEFRDIWLGSGEKPDGLVVLDDMLLADAQSAMLELGVRVPQDLQLAVQTTRDATGPLRLPATVYEIDPDEVAAAHIALLDRRLAGEPADAAATVVAFREQEAGAEAAVGQERIA